MGGVFFEWVLLVALAVQPDILLARPEPSLLGSRRDRRRGPADIRAIGAVG